MKLNVLSAKKSVNECDECARKFQTSENKKPTTPDWETFLYFLEFWASCEILSGNLQKICPRFTV